MTESHSSSRVHDIGARLRALAQGGDITYAFLPSSETDFIKYFAAGSSDELTSSTSPPFRYVAAGEDVAKAQILIITAHGSDLSKALVELRMNVAEDAIIAVWLWDNHIAHRENLMTAHAADFIFPSHAYASGYLANPDSVMGTHVAACTAQWTRAEAARFFTLLKDEPRSDKLLVNYVDYTFSRRAELLKQIAAELPEAEVLVMHAEDRTRYFSKTPFERFSEWARYKSTIILPVDRDLSTRVFDALLAGLVPVVPDTIVEFDRIVPSAIQTQLGIVRIDSTDIASIRGGGRGSHPLLRPHGRRWRNGAPSLCARTAFPGQPRAAHSGYLAAGWRHRIHDRRYRAGEPLH